MVCLLGRNGCGKSTLLRTLAGVQKPLSGTITPTPDEKTLSLVLSAEQPMAATTVHDVVSLGRYPYTSRLGKLTDKDEQIISTALQMVNESMTPDRFSHRKFAALSSGEQQSVLIARALAQQTPLILLDEPTAHLDLPNRIRILRMLQTLAHQEGKTIIVSTHELDLAIQFSDRILLMLPQQGLRLDTPEAFIAQKAFEKAFGCEWTHLPFGHFTSLTCN